MTFSKKATDAVHRDRKEVEEHGNHAAQNGEKFRDVKRTVAFDDQAPIQQTMDELEKMRTDLLSAMFGKKKAK